MYIPSVTTSFHSSSCACCCSRPASPSTLIPHRRPRTPTIRQASSQHLSQVGHSHSILLSPPRGRVTPHRHRIGAPNGTFPSRRSIACRCPASGNQTNGREDCLSAAHIGEVPPSSARPNWAAPRGGEHHRAARLRESVPTGCVPHAQGGVREPQRTSRTPPRPPGEPSSRLWGLVSSLDRPVVVAHPEQWPVSGSIIPSRMFPGHGEFPRTVGRVLRSG